jgi:hypothetical protein
MKHYYFIYLLVTFFYFSCTNGARQKPIINNPEKKEDIKLKPSSSFSDTVKISFPAAVFFKPDSLQLEKIKTITDSAIFESMEHDCFFQMRNARNIVDKYYLGVEIINLTKARFLLFEYKNGIKELIDLDSNNDPCGIYLFDGSRKPVITDMTNIETALSNYFEK